MGNKKISLFQRPVEREIQDGRIAYYNTIADSKFWDELWLKNIKEFDYQKASRGQLGIFFKGPFLKYLPKDGLILEAGCGLGANVIALKALGYDVEGLDYAENTIQAVKAIYPDLPIMHGDVTNVNVVDNYYAGYISLGVMEHVSEGPQSFLNEAFRILKPGGIAIISVPFLNSLRNLKYHLKLYRRTRPDTQFYQYVFKKNDFASEILRCGFEIEEITYYSPITTLLDEIPFAHLFLKGILGKFTAVILHKLPFTRKHLSHMILFIVRKPNQ